MTLAWNPCLQHCHDIVAHPDAVSLRYNGIVPAGHPHSLTPSPTLRCAMLRYAV